MNTNDYIIRLEQPDDYKEVEVLTREAFWNVYAPGCNEHYFVHVMRNHEDFIPELAFVIELNGKIIGNVMYTKAKLISESGEIKPILSFGPVCILPELQRKGYGKALLEHSFSKALKLGYDTIVIFGNPGNYTINGFKSCKKYNVCLAGDIFPTPLLVKELRENTLSGKKWYYHESTAGAPCNDTDAVERFDAQFPHKEKQWRPSQEEFYIYSHSTIG